MAFISSKTNKIPEKPHALNRQEPKFICTFIMFSLFTTLIIILLSMDKPKGFKCMHIINNLNLHVFLKVLFINLRRKSLGKYMINQIADKLKRFVCIHNINNSNLHEYSKILFDNLRRKISDKRMINPMKDKLYSINRWQPIVKYVLLNPSRA